MRLLFFCYLLHTLRADTVTFDTLFEEAQTTTFTTWQRDIRRAIHARPEIGLATYETAARVVDELNALDVQAEAKWAVDPAEHHRGAGIVVDIISGNSKAGTVLLRADMDALPIDEMNDFDFKSKIRGKMHACGHDAHTAMVLGAAKLLLEHTDSWEGTVRLMFQPGEEGYFGGKFMVDEGVLKMKPAVQSAFSIHVIPRLPTGVILGYGGTALAGGRAFHLVIKGTGGHAGVPASARDPVVAAAAFIMQVQNLASRETMGVGAANQGLVSVTQIRTEGAFNVVPEKAKLMGVIRSPNMETLAFMSSRLQDMADALSLSHRVNATLKLAPVIPPLTNNLSLVVAHKKLEYHATKLRVSIPPGEFFYGLEDFAFVANEVPSVMYGVGIGSGGEMPGHPNSNVSVHSPNFVLDERAMPRVSAFLARLAMDELARQASLRSNDVRSEL